jgi:hypothetical protein
MLGEVVLSRCNDDPVRNVIGLEPLSLKLLLRCFDGPLLCQGHDGCVGVHAAALAIGSASHESARDTPMARFT